MTDLRPRRRAGAVAAALLCALAVIVLPGCPFGSPAAKDQRNAPPPPLTKPVGDTLDRLTEVVPVAETGDDLAPAVEMLLATPETALGQPVYASAQAVLRRVTAERLRAAQKAATEKGFAIKVLDAGRAPEVQDALRRLVGPSYLEAPEEDGSCPDTRGAAVDVTLLERRDDGSLVEAPMGSQYMDATDASTRASIPSDPQMQTNRTVLADLMRQQGFEPGPCWWDFHDPEWRDFPVLSPSDYEYSLNDGIEYPAAESGPESAALSESAPAESGESAAAESAASP